MPKSYLSESEKVGLNENTLCLMESSAADDAGDHETSWEWLAKATLPPGALKFLKGQYGADWLLERGFNMTLAEKEYGKDWLNR